MTLNCSFLVYFCCLLFVFGIVQMADEGRLRLQIPDTLVFGEGDAVMWFYTCPDGYVHRCVLLSVCAVCCAVLSCAKSFNFTTQAA